MRILLIAFLIVLSSFLFNNQTLADICTDVEQNSGLKLNEAECYVLEQVEKGKLAHFIIADDFGADFEERFSKKENRELRADFLKQLLTGSFPDLKISDEGVVISNAFINEGLNLKGAIIPLK